MTVALLLLVNCWRVLLKDRSENDLKEKNYKTSGLLYYVMMKSSLANSLMSLWCEGNLFAIHGDGAWYGVI